MRKPVSTSLEASLLKALKIEAIEQDRQLNEVLEDAIKLYLETFKDEHK